MIVKKFGICLVYLTLLVGNISVNCRKGQTKMTRITQNGEGIHMDEATGEIKFPRTLDIEIEVDNEETVKTDVKRIVLAQSPTDAVNGDRLSRVKRVETAYYVDGSSSLEVRASMDDNGQLSTRLRGIIRPRFGRKCWMTDDVTTCWDVQTEGKFGNMDLMPDMMNNKDQEELKHKTRLRRRLMQYLKGRQRDSRRSKRNDISWTDFKANKVVEILYVVDQALFDWFLSLYDTEQEAIASMKLYMILTNNEVNFMYGTLKTTSYGLLQIQVLLVDVIYPANTTEWPWLSPFKNGNESSVEIGSEIWNDFNTWVVTGNNLDSYKYDLVAVVTGLSLTLSGDKGVIGGTYRARVCSGFSLGEKVLFSEDGVYDATWILAHEIGHALGAWHDGVDNICFGKDNIMTPSLPSTPGNNIKFSICSVVEIAMHLAQYEDCLSDYNLGKYIEDLCKGVRADSYDLEFNCQKATRNKDSRYCGPNAGNNRTVVSACWNRYVNYCTDGNGTCDKPLIAMFDGTPCQGENSNSNHVCYKTNCVPEYELCPTNCSCLVGSFFDRWSCCSNKRTIDNACCSGCSLNVLGSCSIA